jgi:hypothetical protein
MQRCKQRNRFASLLQMARRTRAGYLEGREQEGEAHRGECRCDTVYMVSKVAMAWAVGMLAASRAFLGL